MCTDIPKLIDMGLLTSVMGWNLKLSLPTITDKLWKNENNGPGTFCSRETTMWILYFIQYNEKSTDALTLDFPLNFNSLNIFTTQKMIHNTH